MRVVSGTDAAPAPPVLTDAASDACSHLQDPTRRQRCVADSRLRNATVGALAPALESDPCVHVHDVGRRRACRQRSSHPPKPALPPPPTAPPISAAASAHSSFNLSGNTSGAGKAIRPPASTAPDGYAPHVYSERQCNYPSDCPFIFKKHRCGDVAEPCRSAFHGPPSVAPRFCSLRWDSRRFHTAFTGKQLVFVGDSMAAAQWRSLLCLEIGSMRPEGIQHAKKHVASENIPKGTTCVRMGSTITTCYVHASNLTTVLAGAASYRATPNAVLLLSAYAHQVDVSEARNAIMVRDWMANAALGPLHAKVVWRTREADHYGEAGWNGTLEKRSCHAASAAQLKRLAEPFDAGRYAPLKDAGALTLDSRVATEDAERAHPLRCGGTPPDGLWDCRHFCQPGPVDLWNGQLVDIFSLRLATSTR